MLVLLSPQSRTTTFILLSKMLHFVRKMLHHEILQRIDTHRETLQQISTHCKILQRIKNVPTPEESAIPQSVMGKRFAGNPEYHLA